MKPILAAAATALLLVGGSIAFAQQAPVAPDASAAQVRSDDKTGVVTDRRRGRMSAADRAAYLDARLAGIKAGLKLSAEQAALWTPLEAAMRESFAENMEQRAERRDERQQAKQAGQTPDLVKRLRERSERLSDRAENLKKVADAAEPLYKSLDNDQKQRLQALMGADRQGRPRKKRMQRG